MHVRHRSVRHTTRVAIALTAVVVAFLVVPAGPAGSLDNAACDGDTPDGYACVPLLNKGTGRVIGELFFNRDGGGLGDNVEMLTNLFRTADSGHADEKLCMDDDRVPFDSRGSCVGGNAGSSVGADAILPAPESGEEEAGKWEVFRERFDETGTVDVDGQALARYVLFVDGYEYFSFHFNQSGNSVEAFFHLPVQAVQQATALRFATQPADAQKSTIISSEPGKPNGTPILVEVVDANGDVVTGSTATVSMALASNPAGGSLTGTTTRNAVAGVATFDDLKIDLDAVGYQLSASSSGLTSATSTAFTIWDRVIDCSTSCQGSESVPREMTTTVTAPPTQGALLFLSVGALPAVAVDCGDTSNHAPHVTSTDAIGFPDGATKLVDVLVDARIDRLQPNNGVAFYDICFLSPDSFKTKDGSDALQQPNGEYLGLLPDCTASTPSSQPCVSSRTKTQKGDVIVQLRAKAADPSYR